MPSVVVASATATTISLSWSVPYGSVVDNYQVMWQGDTSGNCSTGDVGSTAIADGSTSYQITGLQENSNFNISLIATNAAGSAVCDSITAMTEEASEGYSCVISTLTCHRIFILCRTICPSHFHQYI